MKKKLVLILLAACLAATDSAFAQNPWNGKVILEGYWWDYWNNNYPNGWSNYMADLAPRLAAIGIDKVWLPPNIKNSGTNSDGYSPFDYYDLGDKYQKGSLKTRSGDKNEALRVVAVLHANGMEAVEDAVLGHVSDAGSNTGAGGQDTNSYSLQTNNGYKNFRYACYAQPVTNESAADYLSRKGRWSMNWENFFPNAGNNHFNTNNYDQILFGATDDYDASAYGTSSNATYNPTQASGYMETNARNWLVWYKQQTGCDGFRLDAAKNYPAATQQDILYNAKYNASFASGGANMFAVGEIVGSATDEDNYVTGVQYSNGGSENMVGAFDYNLRSALEQVVADGGSYDLSTIPAQQQNQRYRTVPFVNNHDTFHPTFDANGNYTGWNTGAELAGGHINPFDARLSVVYAIAFAVDGSPQVYFEDLFNLGNTSKRWTHYPTSATDLPMRDDIVNIIWCHQKLNFKKGTYKVRYGAADLLIIERGYNAGPENSYAIIGINDNYNTWQNATIQTDFGPNVQLHDYSGANSDDIYTDASGMATIYVPPCDSSNRRRGYCIWGPAGISGTFTPTQNSTTQQWEMADDLGDSHPSSLKQGGALPDTSIAFRLAGQVYDQSGKTITVNVYPAITAENLTVGVFDSNDTLLQSVSDTGILTLTYTPSATGYYRIKLRNTVATNPGQNAYVKVNYTAPVVTGIATPPVTTQVSNIATAKPFILTNYPNPFTGATTISYTLPQHTWTNMTVYDMHGRSVYQLANDDVAAGTHETSVDLKKLPAGTYMLTMRTAYGLQSLAMTLAK